MRKTGEERRILVGASGAVDAKTYGILRIGDNAVVSNQVAIGYYGRGAVYLSGNAELDFCNPRDKWLYALYHLWRYDSYPEELQDEIFQKFYRQAEYANFNSVQQLTYERSQKYYRDTIEEIRGGRILGHEEGFIEGREKGLAEGHEKGLAEGMEQGRENALSEIEFI